MKVAYKKWVGRPLCVDHQSQSVDKTRGVIVDTVYDDVRKRVIALCALDKANYPDLARKVSSGYSTNVSMGTAVGRAVCSECGKVAKTESDFCNHMRSKSCYGEINLDLSPMELSLVVSGADPKAKVKHIIAKDLSRSVDALQDYVGKKISSGTVNIEELMQVKDQLAGLVDKIGTLISSDDENEVVGPTESKQPVDEDFENGFNFNIPESIPSYASELYGKIASLQEGYTKLASIIKNREENNMGTDKKAYFQGTVEPNAGGTKYPPEPGQEIRMQDKHMHGAGPFPGVGNVEGMYPGISESDEQRKRRLQRLAEEEQRKMVREAAVKKAKEQLAKQSYMQGTEEPKTYPKDPLNEKARKEDKHMQGAPPFPGVGDVEGLYGDDLAEKEKLSRASLKATFRKVTAGEGKINKGASRWDIYANDQLILSATVDDISRGNSDLLYDSIATKPFGKGLIDKIKSQGFTSVAQSLTKQAQVPPAGPGVPAAEPPVAGPGEPVGGPAEAPAEAPLEEPTDVGGGDVDTLVKDLGELGQEIASKVSDLEEALGPVEEDGAGLGDVEPMAEGDMEKLEGAPPQSLAAMQSFRKGLNGMIVEGIKETVGDLKAHAKEIEVTKNTYAERYASFNDEQRKYLNSLASSAVKDAKSTLADALEVMGAVVKYAQGTEVLVKNAQETQDEKDETENADQMADDGAVVDSAPANDEDIAEASDENNADEPMTVYDAPEATIHARPAPARPATPEGQAMQSDLTEAFRNALKPMEGATPGLPAPEDLPPALNADDGNDAMVEVPDETKTSDLPAGATLASNKPDLTTKEGRAMYRMKLAQNGLTWSDMPNQAHSGSVQPEGLDTKPTAPFSKFHVLKDTHDAMMNLANLAPTVRKAVQDINSLVSSGELDPSEVDELAKYGVDSEAIKYWKQYWAEAKDSESKDFAAKLVQQQAKQKAAENLEASAARIKRAYELAYNMRDKGMIETTQIDSQVSEIMKWNDDGFNSIKNIVGNQPVVKKASIPNVGLLSSGDVILPMAEVASQDVDLNSFLADYFKGKKL